MPRPTSDFRTPVCLEMKTIRSQYAPIFADTQPPRYSSSTVAVPAYYSAASGDHLNNNASNNNNEMGSMDSSGTFASCNTHPFLSQGDLTSEVDSNLYVNPMDKGTDNSPVQATNVAFGRNSRPPPVGVKKSASGDTALRSLGASPCDEAFKGFGTMDCGSRGSLNDSPLPKHRKMRFQQSVRPRMRFGDSTPAAERLRFESQESLESKKPSRRASFMPTRSLASATRIINQHLFGLQTLSGSRTGKNGSSKSSLSVDSIDSHASTQLEKHRRSKSILKKSDSSGHRNGRTEDPESERLISDNMSGVGGDGGSGSDYSPNKRPVVSSPPVRHRAVAQRTVAKTPPIKYQQQSSQESEKSRGFKSSLFLLDNILAGGGEKHQRDRVQTENRYKDGGDLGMSEGADTPLYICPPPPPMEDNSPTEETRLLLHQTPVPQHKQTVNSTAKGSGFTS